MLTALTLITAVTSYFKMHTLDARILYYILVMSDTSEWIHILTYRTWWWCCCNVWFNDNNL